MDSDDGSLLMDDIHFLNEEYYSDYAGDCDSEDDDGLVNNSQVKHYNVLKGEDIHQRQEDDITRISAVLSIPRDAACRLLIHYNWRANEVQDEWFCNEERVRKAVGLLDSPVVRFPEVKIQECDICFETYGVDTMKAASCGHLFCTACWTSYISISINDGPGCLNLRCPAYPKCCAGVGVDMVDMLASERDREKYRRFLLRSYIEQSSKTKWCPAPGCDCAIEFDIGSENFDVCCDCKYNFCWNCTEETHRPVDCDTVSKWLMKNSSEAENTNWILANSKPCPKCKRAIEKSLGCMHMTCAPPCNYAFCWLCLGPWKEHGKNTGGFYACNRFEAKKQECTFDEGEEQKEMAKRSIEKYTHYYERWNANHKSREKACDDLHKVKVRLAQLVEKQGFPETELEYIPGAWEQIVECRRVLKWTYAYGYYMPETEDAKKTLFEYLQGEAEAGLERLHRCVETELETYYKKTCPEKFRNFRPKLVDLTTVTGRYFENLVRALENGLLDVEINLP